jgi:N-acetylmuramoyl-L-alanine amidase
MWQILRRPIATLMLATLTLAGMILLALPIRSQQNGRLPAAISQTQPPSNSLPQQNSSSSASVGQLSSSAATEEAAGVTVVLDPAHGGADFGARGPTGLAESDVVLDFARAARIALEAQRLRVLLTREGNQDPSFDNRSAMVNGLRNAVLVSLHVSSSGPVGTARAYYYAFPAAVAGTANSTANAATTAGQNSAPATGASQSAVRNNLIEWDHAQRSSVDLSRQLATLAQTELVRRFHGSPEMPIAAPVRQLRTVVAPAIAIELSSIDVTDAKRLDQMAQPLAEAIGRAVAEFHYPASAPTAPGAAAQPNVSPNLQPNGPAAPNTIPAPASGVH